MDDLERPVPAAPAAWTRTPRIRALSTRQARVVLARNHVARIAFQAGGRIELMPVHYVCSGDAIFGRTSFGGRCVAWEHAGVTPVVLEVDEPEGVFDWRSVIVRGALRVLPSTGARLERTDHWEAVAAIRTLVPDAFTERDPTPSRRCVFRIELDEVSGREASTRFRR